MIAGVDYLPPGQSPSMGDPLIWWPGDIEQLINQADAEIKGLARDVARERSASGTAVISDASLAGFKAFYNEWEGYRVGLSWFGRISGGTVDRVQEFRRRAADWRTRLEESGARFSAPKPTNLVPKGPFGDLFADVAVPLKWAAIGAAVFVAYKVAKETGILKTGGDSP